MSSGRAELKEGASAAKFFVGSRDEEVDFPGAELKMEELRFFEDEEEEEEEESVRRSLALPALERALLAWRPWEAPPVPREAGWKSP